MERGEAGELMKGGGAGEGGAGELMEGGVAGELMEGGAGELMKGGGAGELTEGVAGELMEGGGAGELMERGGAGTLTGKAGVAGTLGLCVWSLRNWLAPGYYSLGAGMQASKCISMPRSPGSISHSLEP
jgi:hypothetical protein